MPYSVYNPEASRRMREEAETRRTWREERNRLQEVISLKRQQQAVDLSNLDRSAGRIKIILDRQGDSVEQLKGLLELIGDFTAFIRRAEEKEVNTSTLRRKLQNLQLRAYNLYKEMIRHERAHEFNEKDLRGLIRDYETLRK